jgi:alkaline phosphatase D
LRTLLPRRYAAWVLPLASLLLAGGGAAAQGELFPDGIAIGDVTSDAAVIWTRLAGGGEVRIEVSVSPGYTGAKVAVARALAESDDTAKIEIAGLHPGQRYYARVLSGGHLGPAATFVTAPAPDQDAPLSVIWGADTFENYQPFRVFEAMRGRHPDLFLFLGDTIYADLGQVRAVTLDEYRQKYRRNRQDAALRAFLASTVSWVVWDDHEVSNNFDGRHPRLEVGRRALLEYWPIRTPAGQATRLYRSIRWGRTSEVFILDTRQYRSPSAAPDGPEKTMLGGAQKQWLLDGLARSQAAIKIVASTVTLRYAGRDSWEGYARERDEILRSIRDRPIQNVIFLAADVHYAALIRHPEGVYEAVSGPLAAFPAGTARAQGRPGTLWAETGRSNYGWIRMGADGIVAGWWDDRDGPMHQTRIPFQR